jgi:hypothetical protein
LRVVRAIPFDPVKREEGLDWPAHAETMIGLKRLENLQTVVTDVVRRGVPGDLVETGAWRGGACIFMRGVLRALGDPSRCVWVCDSFQGLPPPDARRYPADAGDVHFSRAELAVSEEDVRANFARYGLLDDRVRFLSGWFRNTLPTAPIEQIAVLRLDGDMYESTWDALVNLYSKIVPGGYVVVDDYGGIAACQMAVADFRREQGIEDEIHGIDSSGVYWRRSASPHVQIGPGGRASVPDRRGSA